MQAIAQQFGMQSPDGIEGRQETVWSCCGEHCPDLQLGDLTWLPLWHQPGIDHAERWSITNAMMIMLSAGLQASGCGAMLWGVLPQLGYGGVDRHGSGIVGVLPQFVWREMGETHPF